MAGRVSASPPSRRGPGAFALVGRRSTRSRSSSIHSAQPSCTRHTRYPQPHAFSVRAFLLRPSFCPFVAGLRRPLYSLEFMRAFCLNLEAGSPGALSRLFIYWEPSLVVDPVRSLYSPGLVRRAVALVIVLLFGIAAYLTLVEIPELNPSLLCISIPLCALSQRVRDVRREQSHSVPVLSFRRALSSLSYIPVPVMPAGAMAGQA